MKTKIQILHVEDSDADAELIHARLEEEQLNCEVTRVLTERDYARELEQGSYDLILSDFSLPGFGGMQALALARQRRPDWPFIFASGTIGDDRAVEALKQGATDYVLKDRLARLGTAIRRALADAVDCRLREMADAALRQSEERFRTFMEHTPAVTFIKDEQGRYLYINQTNEKTFQRTAESVYGKTDIDLLGSARATDLMRNDQEVLREGRPLQTTEMVRTPDGIEREWMVLKFPILVKAGTRYLAGQAIDVTAQRQAERRVIEQADWLDKASDAIIVSTLEGEINYWNCGAERMFGWTRDEAVGRIAPRLLQSEAAPAELEQAHRTLIATGEWSGELRVAHRNGTRVCVASRWTLIRDPQGQPKAKLLINTDITEKLKLEEQFLRAQRLESIGLLASGIAHDLNNVLAPFMMIIPLLRERLNDPSFMRILDSLESSAERGSGLVQQILSFARGAETEKVLVQTRHIIRDLEKMVRDAFPRSIQFERNIATDLWVVKANPTHLHQVLLNLLVNARDAMPDGGRLTLGAANCVLDDGQAGLIPEGRSGNYVRVSVADTGTGIAPEVLPRIFDPFFTTKPQGQGTGLGLSTLLGIVKNYNGFTEVRTAVGKGTTFLIYLPADMSGQVVETGGAEKALPRGAGELILLVDDDASIRQIFKTALTNYGYRALAAANGVEAMSEFLAHRQEISLLITDLIMPVMDGVALVKAVRYLDPRLPIMVMGGLETGHADCEYISQQTRGELRKPFGPAELLHTVESALAKKEV